MSQPAIAPRFRTRLMVLLIFTLAVGSYHWILDLDFTGLDAAPLLDANRFDREGGALGSFGREIRDGIEPDVAFYRPLTGLSHGFDHWWWGLEARGHHLTHLLLHAAVAMALLALVVSLGAPAAGALLAAAWFAVHPLGVEVVPCTARRAELWVGLCLLLACLAWLHRENGRRAAGALLILAGLFAPLAKETGLVLPVLLVALAPLGRRRAALLWGLLLITPALLARSFVLGGVGGYGGLSLSFHGLLPAIGDLFDPARVEGVHLVRIVAGLVLLFSLVAALRGRGENRPIHRFGLTWFLVLIAPMVLARGISPWYLYTPLLGVAMLLAGLFENREFGTTRWRRIALGLLVLLAVLPGFLVSPMAVAYPEWFEVSRQSRIWQAVVEELPEEFFDGPQLVAGLPIEVDYPPRRGVRVRAASALSDFSLRAWIRLRRDRDSQPVSAGYSRIVQPAARYSVQVSWIPREKAVRLWAQGPAVLVLHDKEHPFRLHTNSPDEIKMSRLEAPLWRWNGKQLVRVPLPSADG